MLKTLEAPIRQIAENAGVEGSIVVGKISENKSETYGTDGVGLALPAEAGKRLSTQGPPKIGESVARAKPERIVDMGFRLFSAPEEALGHTNVPVSVSEIAVDRKRPLELGNSVRDPDWCKSGQFPSTRVPAPFRARWTAP